MSDMIQSQSAKSIPNKMVKNARQRKRSLLIASPCLPSRLASLILPDPNRGGWLGALLNAG
jgi:hypothetical protein